MKIIEKIKNKQSDLQSNEPITIAFLGDSVTQGCHECYIKSNGHLETIFDYNSAYSTRLRELLNFLYPNVQINIINSGISGDNATSAANRIKRDVLRYCPDLVVVSFGLNDCGAGLDNLDNYANALREIFKQIKESGAECIFLTQNYMATKVSCHIKDEFFVNLARQLSEIQNSGVLKKYFEKAKEVCSDMSVDVCDLYEVWEKLEKAEVDVTELLSNKMNHPVKEYHYYIAIKLLEKIIEV